MTPIQQIDADLQQRLYELRSILGDLADRCHRLGCEIDERGLGARLPETVTASALGTQIDRYLAVIAVLRSQRERLGGAS